MTPFRTNGAPSPSGPYSQAAASGNMVFVSGQIPIDPADGKMPEGTEEQIRAALRNVTAILSASGVEDGGVLSVTVYLTDMNDFALMNQIYAETFAAPYPARTCIGVSSLPKGAAIMVDAVGEISGHR